jgi:hypothetical protein
MCAIFSGFAEVYNKSLQHLIKSTLKKLQNFRVRNETRDCGVLKHETLHYSKEPLIIVEE